MPPVPLCSPLFSVKLHLASMVPSGRILTTSTFVPSSVPTTTTVCCPARYRSLPALVVATGRTYPSRRTLTPLMGTFPAFLMLIVR